MNRILFQQDHFSVYIFFFGLDLADVDSRTQAPRIVAERIDRIRRYDSTEYFRHLSSHDVVKDYPYGFRFGMGEFDRNLLIEGIGIDQHPVVLI